MDEEDNDKNYNNIDDGYVKDNMVNDKDQDQDAGQRIGMMT